MESVLSHVPQPQPHRAPAAVASWRHTIGLFTLFVIIGLASATYQSTSAPVAPSPLALYVPILVLEWLLLYGVWRGLRAHGVSLRALVGGDWSSARAIGTDVLIAAAMWGVWMGISA